GWRPHGSEPRHPPRFAPAVLISVQGYLARCRIPTAGIARSRRTPPKAEKPGPCTGLFHLTRPWYNKHEGSGYPGRRRLSPPWPRRFAAGRLVTRRKPKPPGPNGPPDRGLRRVLDAKNPRRQKESSRRVSNPPTVNVA